MKLSIIKLIMPASKKLKKHLEKLAEMKRGVPSPLRGRIIGKRTVKQKKRMSLAQKKYFETHDGTRKGKKASKETKNKIRKSRLGMKFSEEHKEAISCGGRKRWDKTGRVSHGTRFRMQDRKLKKWRKKVFERDNWTCQLCDTRGGNLEAHHKKPWAKYPKLRYIVSNGITLCYKCHKKIDPYRR